MGLRSLVAVPFYFVHINVFRQLYIHLAHKYGHRDINTDIGT